MIPAAYFLVTLLLLATPENASTFNISVFTNQLTAKYEIIILGNEQLK